MRFLMTKIDFAHRSDVVARTGSRESCCQNCSLLRCSATPKNSNFFGLGIFFFVIFLDFGGVDNFRCQNQLPREILFQIYRFSNTRTKNWAGKDEMPACGGARDGRIIGALNNFS